MVGAHPALGMVGLRPDGGMVGRSPQLDMVGRSPQHDIVLLLSSCVRLSAHLLRPPVSMASCINSPTCPKGQNGQGESQHEEHCCNRRNPGMAAQVGDGREQRGYRCRSVQLP
jgi:hypothetical protein